MTERSIWYLIQTNATKGPSLPGIAMIALPTTLRQPESEAPETNLRLRKVGSIVADDYRRAHVMKQFGIEFCCGGGIALAEACERKKVDVEQVIAAIEDVGQTALSVPHGVGRWSDDLLMHYIEDTHHEYVRQAIPTLRAFTRKVAKVHGEAVPALVEVADTFETMAVEMEAHMAYEEDVLFAAIRRQPDSAVELVDRAEEEHVVVGEAMHRIRELTHDFTPPDWACATYRAAFALLEEFESDLHAHVHLENNVLFARLPAGS